MDSYDVIVVGAGPAGLTAGIYTGRARLKTLVLEGMMPGGQVVVTAHIENYPGVGPTTGSELIAGMVGQMTSFGAELKTAQASSIEATDDGFVVGAGSNEFWCRSVIVATGTAYKKLGVPEKNLKAWVEQAGWESVLNKRGTTWRKLPDDVKENIDEASSIALMLENPSAIKRPVLEADKALLIGFKEDEYQKLA